MKQLLSQEKVYFFIVDYVKEHLYAPTVSEICDSMKFQSRFRIRSRLEALDKKGLIELEKQKPYRIKLRGYIVIPTETLVKLYEDYERRDGK